MWASTVYLCVRDGVAWLSKSKTPGNVSTIFVDRPVLVIATNRNAAVEFLSDWLRCGKCRFVGENREMHESDHFGIVMHY